MSAAIIAVEWDDRRCAPLVAEGEAGDGPFLSRLLDEGLSGACRFERPGEFLLAAESGGELIAIGGVSLDPYDPAEGLGRVRHVYVLKANRGRGIGRRLMEEILARSRGKFARLRLRTREPEAVSLYESLGFVRTDALGETHRLAL